MPRSYREPEYRRRIIQETEKNKSDSNAKERETSQEGHIEKLISAIHRVEQELYRANDEASPKNTKQYWWEKAGVIGLWAAACVGFIAVFVSSLDSHHQRGVMQGQLKQMQADGEARKRESAATLRLDIVREFNGTEWNVTTQWLNVGKTNALNFRGWSDRHFFNASDIVNDFAFTKPSANKWNSEVGGVVPPEDKATMPTQIITWDEAWKSIYGLGFVIVYGRAEHDDIFGWHYDMGYCGLLNFDWHGHGQIVPNLTLPVKLALPCFYRTEQKIEAKQQ